MKRYIVFIEDQWNNLYWIGEFSRLEDALPDINLWLESYNIELSELVEYSSTFGNTFDTIIDIDEDGEFVMVRGFILEE